MADGNRIGSLALAQEMASTEDLQGVHDRSSSTVWALRVDQPAERTLPSPEHLSRRASTGLPPVSPQIVSSASSAMASGGGAGGLLPDALGVELLGAAMMQGGAVGEQHAYRPGPVHSIAAPSAAITAQTARPARACACVAWQRGSAGSSRAAFRRTWSPSRLRLAPAARASASRGAALTAQSPTLAHAEEISIRSRIGASGTSGTRPNQIQWVRSRFLPVSTRCGAGTGT